MTLLPTGIQQESDRRPAGFPVRASQRPETREQDRTHPSIDPHQRSPQPVDNSTAAHSTTATITIMDGESKTCRGCLQTLPVEAFNRSARDGLQSLCRDCKRAYNAANREAINRREREYLTDRRRRAGIAPRPLGDGRTHHERTYGLTPPALEAKRAEQLGACAICHRETPRLVVDHDHQTGRLRGLLCNRCNLALGIFDDDADLLAQAIEYLASADWPAGWARP